MTNVNAADKITDQFRDMTDKVYLAGELKSVSNVREATDKNGNAYISLKGVVVCSEDPAHEVKFDSYIGSYFTKQNKANPNFTYIKNAIAKLEENTKKALRGEQTEPVMIDMAGSIKDNPFYNAKSGKMYTTNTKRDMVFFSDFKNYKSYASIEGFIKSVRDEERNGEMTGRKIVTLVSKDGAGHIMEVEGYLDEERAEQFDDAGYEKGITATFRIEYTPIKHEGNVVSDGGFGIRPDAGVFVSVTPMIVGADPIKDDKQLETKLIKKALDERKLRLNEVEAQGKARANGGAPTGWGVTTSTAATNAKSTSTKSTAKDDEIPFDEDDDDDNSFF